jgi:hypothetical protein
MKRVNKIVLLVIVLTGYTSVVLSQNLDLMPQAQRDSILIAKAKEMVLKYGPEYYREYKSPVIDWVITPPKGETNITGENAGRKVYIVIFLYDSTIETLEAEYAAWVAIWADTGNPYSILFGNCIGLDVESLERDIKKQKSTPQIRYQQSGVKRIRYETQEGVPVDKANPKNIDELKRRGYEYKDGEWIKTRKDVPPNIDILKREGYEEVNGQWLKKQKDIPTRIK